MGLPSVMQHSFANVPKALIPRSQFNRSHGYKTTFDSGYLVPVFVDEVLPGDSFNLRMSVFARLATPLHPYMDNAFLDSFFFFVPTRLVWDNWQKFNGEQIDPGDSTDYLVPTMTSTAVTGYANQSLHDYFGIPTEVPGLQHISLYHRAYNLIWNEWFRDQNLQDSVVVDRDDGPDLPTDYVLLRRGKRHDYFTSCLPWPQKGDAVTLPLGTTAPVVSDGTVANFKGVTSNAQGNLSYTTAYGFSPATGTWSNGELVKFGSNPGLEVNLEDATAATINQLRQAFKVQELFERDARGGTRYIEILRSHFGVISPDARLQRPEYLGGGSSPINVHPVAQTSSTDEASPQGNLAAFATASVSGHGFSKSFVEHGIIIGLVSVRADLSYQQGLNRMWSRQIRWDYYWPPLDEIGEQAVLNKEIYAQGTANPTQDADVFGYQERYAEYRYKPSVITGRFRSNYAQSLDTWHLAQDFASLPVLNSEFIVDNPPFDRVLAVTEGEPQFLFDSYFKLLCARPMKTYSMPALLGRF